MLRLKLETRLRNYETGAKLQRSKELVDASMWVKKELLQKFIVREPSDLAGRQTCNSCFAKCCPAYELGRE